MQSPPSGTETFERISGGSSFSASSFAPLASSASAPLAITSLCSATECCDEHSDSSSSEYSSSSPASPSKPSDAEPCEYSSFSLRAPLLAPLLNTRSSPESWRGRSSFSAEPESCTKARHTHSTTILEQNKPRVLVGFFLQVTWRGWTHKVSTFLHGDF